MSRKIKIKRKKVQTTRKDVSLEKDSSSEQEPSLEDGSAENSSSLHKDRSRAKKKLSPPVIIGMVLIILACAAAVGYKFFFAKPDVTSSVQNSVSQNFVTAFNLKENVRKTMSFLSVHGINEGIEALKYKSFGGKENYDNIVAALAGAGCDVASVNGLDIISSNNSSGALYGSVVRFRVQISYTDSAKSAQTAVLENVNIDSYDGFTPVRSNILFVTGGSTASCTVSFYSCSKSFSYNVVNQSTSFDNIDILVNKISRIDSSYEPNDLTESSSVPYVYPAGDEVNHMRSEASAALSEMISAASGDGIQLYALSGHRSYETQEYLYNRAGGDSQNNTAAPGASEHQTGLCMDITWSAAGMGLSSDMRYDSEYDWLINNSYLYGFVLRYPDGWDDITGYVYEPWHYRYIGREAAAEYHSSSAYTLEEFLSTPR